ncbi:hypothetical protein BDQ94DRAFT_75652 [Aspergillus welwitschiae]|uniref:Uncharacterized protein n=1 Tax=Aspergillus welwitschiae TaxID=1341132 RepID=A0A3F3PU22_9EURO|nr:hypothetical protein BDQ94DRAFT_75652 [Aspergillus welwitschiae]RDH30365.1 hypothetical protein BDQ94DRAFT_75652 [Aspergillus welwitschiae]
MPTYLPLLPLPSRVRLMRSFEEIVFECPIMTCLWVSLSFLFFFFFFSTSILSCPLCKVSVVSVFPSTFSITSPRSKIVIMKILLQPWSVYFPSTCRVHSTDPLITTIIR